MRLRNGPVLGAAVALAVTGWIAAGTDLLSTDIVPLGLISREQVASALRKEFGSPAETTLVFCRGVLDDWRQDHHGCPARAGWFYTVRYRTGTRAVVNAHSGWSSLDPPPSGF